MLQRLFAAYQEVDPPRQVQSALTPKFLRKLYRHFCGNSGTNNHDTMHAHMADLLLGFFFFAGRSCEYCLASREGKTKRVALGDIGFRDRRKNAIDIDSWDDVQKACYVTITFRDQKNGEKGERRTQGRTGDEILDPVVRLGSAVLRLKRKMAVAQPTTELCNVGREDGVERLSARIILQSLKFVCNNYGGKKEFGFTAGSVGNKSLRSGAAMSLALSPKNYSTMKIMVLGRWKSDKFMRYIRPQVLELTSGLAGDMVDADFVDLGDDNDNDLRAFALGF